MHTCPTCGDTFNSRHGLRVHHGSAHGERLPNRTCSYCDTRFYCKHEKKYCSDECRDEAVSFEGAANPNYQGKKSTTTCDICGSQFEYYPSEKEGRFCATCVEEEPWRTPPDLEGEDHPRWNGGKVELECEGCNESIERYPSNITGEVTFCSDDCRSEWLSEEFSESGHPNWKGGGNGSYGKGWNAVRRRALERDGYECVVCSKSKKEIGRNPDVHHIVPVRQFVASDDHAKEDAHYLANVVSLCVDCHRKADFGKIPKSKLRSFVESKPAPKPATA